MPNRYGNAIKCFSPKKNKVGLTRGYNFSMGSPKAKDYDLLVCNIPPIYGHISEVGKDYIVIAQQNSSSPFARITLKEEVKAYPIEFTGFYDPRRNLKIKFQLYLLHQFEEDACTNYIGDKYAGTEFYFLYKVILQKQQLCS